jgi:hypothetical protein
MLTSNMVDIGRLQQDIHLLTVECIHLKQILGTRWTRPMAHEQRRLVRIRRKLASSQRFVLLAVSRKRLHVIHPPRDVDREAWDAVTYNTTIATRILSEYAPEAASAEAAR